MTSTNQVQPMPSGYYSDQYVEVAATFRAGIPSIPGNTFATTLRFHKVGRKVTVEMIGTVTNTAPDITVERYDSTVAVVPLEFRPSTVKYNTICCATNTPERFQTGMVLVQAVNGFMYVFPSLTNTSAVPAFIPGTYVQYSTFTYFI